MLSFGLSPEYIASALIRTGLSPQNAYLAFKAGQRLSVYMND